MINRRRCFSLELEGFEMIETLKYIRLAEIFWILIGLGVRLFSNCSDLLCFLSGWRGSKCRSPSLLLKFELLIDLRNDFFLFFANFRPQDPLSLLDQFFFLTIFKEPLFFLQKWSILHLLDFPFRFLIDYCCCFAGSQCSWLIHCWDFDNDGFYQCILPTVCRHSILFLLLLVDPKQSHELLPIRTVPGIEDEAAIDDAVENPELVREGDAALAFKLGHAAAEGMQLVEHLVKDDPESPDVALGRVGGSACSEVDLGSHCVGCSAAPTVHLQLVPQELGAPEVRDFEHASADEDVLELEITVNDCPFLKSLHPCDQLFEVTQHS